MNQLPQILSTGHLVSSETYKNVSQTKERLTTEYELELFSNDSGVTHINKVSHNIKKGDVLLARPGDLRYSTFPMSCHFIHFKTTDKLTIQLLNEIPNYFSIQQYDEFQEFFTRIHQNTFFCNEYKTLQNAADLLHMLCVIKNDYFSLQSMPSMNTAKYQILTKAIDFIDKNYQTPITAGDIAQHCNISISHLHKLFTQMLNSTPNSYLTNTRINASKNMLLYTDTPLSEIAFSCGFSSQSYFCQCFKQFTQVSPSHFRNASKAFQNKN